MTQLLISHKLTSKLIACFEDEETHEQMCQYVDDLSYEMINIISKKISELKIKNRVNITTIIDDINCDENIEKSDKDESVLGEMMETFSVHIENEEGWGSDDDESDTKLIASKILESSKKENDVLKECAREYLEKMTDAVIKKMYETI